MSAPWRKGGFDHDPQAHRPTRYAHCTVALDTQRAANLAFQRERTVTLVSKPCPYVPASAQEQVDA